MSDHKPPVYRLLSKNEGDEKLTEIGQVWATAKENVFSVVLDLEDTGEKLRFIMMPNTPKLTAIDAKAQHPSEPAKTAARRRTSPQPRPAA